MSNFLLAHNINYDKIILRHWTVEKQNKTVDGSFYMYKNGNVFIEDANDKIVDYPLSFFSKEDQAFAIKKAMWVKELVQKNPNITIEEVKKNLEMRDYIDSNREISPLKQATDALFLLDNTLLTEEEQFQLALSWARNRI